MPAKSHRYCFVFVLALFLSGGAEALLPIGRSGRSIAHAQESEKKDLDFDLSLQPKKNPPKKNQKKKQLRKKRQKSPAGKAKQTQSLDLGFDALDVSVKSAEKEVMDKALDLMKDRDYAAAAVAFNDIYNNPRASKYFQSAEYQLAKALYRMRLYHTSLERFGKILDQGVNHKYFRTSLEWLFFISHKISDQSEVLKDVARYADIDFPKKYRDEFLFLLAKYFYFRAVELEKSSGNAGGRSSSGKNTGGNRVEEFGFDLGGSEETKPQDGFGLDLEVEKKTAPSALPSDTIGFLSKSKAMILQIDNKSKFYPKGKYLEGVVLYKQGNFQQAVESFKEVVKLLNPKKARLRDDILREDAFFQLARIHYEHKQFRYALFYYDKIHRDSIAWLESLFESSWAWFRLGQYQKALGNLITLDSPFFREEYFPEGLILKAVTYYENCRYPESNQIVQEFKRRYEPLHRELAKLLKSEKTPDSYYRKLLAIQKVPPHGQSGKLLRRILKVALADRDIRILNESVLEHDREIQRIRDKGTAFTRSKLATRLVGYLQKRKVELVKKAGLLTKLQLEQEHEFLGEWIGQALRIKLENDQAELEVLRKVQAGEVDLGPTLLPYEWTGAVDDEKLYWPYQGEYWRDELGTYEYTLTWGCRKRTE